MMEMGQYLQQNLSLVMTAELRQAIAVLQYPGYELASFLQEQANENPLIEVIEPPGIIGKSPSSRKSSSSAGMPVSFEEYMSSTETLHDTLLKQSILLSLSEKERRMLNFLLLSIDDNGYLTVSAAEAAQHLGASEEIVDKLIVHIHQMEPAGIGARSLQECLLLQLAAAGMENTLPWRLVLLYFEELANRKWRAVADELQLSPEDIQHAADYIQTLNPRPGKMYSHGVKEGYLYPDITITHHDGSFAIAFNDRYNPSVKLNSDYEPLLFMSKNDQPSKYLQNQFSKYQWLKKAVEQRRQTLIKIVTEVVNVQHSFFSKKGSQLAPLTLKQVAAATGMHESTISRAVKNKVIQTPLGARELKSFFTAKIETSEGGEASASAAKDAIRRLIEKENKQKPLSDQLICEMLKRDDGLAISRRTVAKYREELMIPSSSKRKRFV
ncbi:RNA polymerase factor sigma-54 [Fictibacillus iocasae]|uniref:RNA polymerase factor sigma-54 n=1 Tax=Fictibacillus iocasae TaxID=2715437 RepID=A0ABW2NNY0_9BACL